MRRESGNGYFSGLDFASRISLAMFAALISPFLLIVVENLWLPYPAIAEETTKALVVFLLILGFPRLRQKFFVAAFFGLLFGLSESVFYLVNIINSGNIELFWVRLALTVPMHVISTLLILTAGLFGRYYLVFGLGTAIIFHTIFNLLAAGGI